jgi:hypothetical protein
MPSASEKSERIQWARRGLFAGAIAGLVLGYVWTFVVNHFIDTSPYGGGVGAVDFRLTGIIAYTLGSLIGMIAIGSIGLVLGAFYGWWKSRN